MDWGRIRNDDRVVLVGTTGSGKTTLLRYLIRTRPYVLLYDPKGDEAWEDGEWLTVRSTDRLPRKSFPPRVRYYPHPELLREKEEIDRFFWYAYHARNLVVVVDEAYLATLAGTWMPPGYHACITQGRSRGVGVWTATQRPHKIPQVILSEAEHMFIFRLNSPVDRNAIWQWAGISPRDIAALPKRVWYYSSQGDSEGPYTLDIGGG